MLTIGLHELKHPIADLGDARELPQGAPAKGPFQSLNQAAVSGRAPLLSSCCHPLSWLKSWSHSFPHTPTLLLPHPPHTVDKGTQVRSQDRHCKYPHVQKDAGGSGGPAGGGCKDAGPAEAAGGAAAGMRGGSRAAGRSSRARCDSLRPGQYQKPYMARHIYMCLVVSFWSLVAFAFALVGNTSVPESYMYLVVSVWSLVAFALVGNDNNIDWACTLSELGDMEM